MLIVALVISRLDYCNAVLVGLLAYLTRRLQSVLIAAARLVFNLCRSDHITDALITQPAMATFPKRTKFKTARL